jgi:hypothetical protein
MILGTNIFYGLHPSGYIISCDHDHLGFYLEDGPRQKLSIWSFICLSIVIKCLNDKNLNHLLVPATKMVTKITIIGH